ncbi:MAG: HAD-IIB family hydrolase [Bacteroidales bacterium]
MRDVSLLIFSDLDGTLLDSRSYSFEAAREGLDAVTRAGVPLILCSSKTRVEIESLQYDLLMEFPHIRTNGDPMLHPFISENGGALFVPRGYFAAAHGRSTRAGAYETVEFGRRYGEVVAALRRTAERVGVPVRGFSTMSAEDISRECGCSLTQARLAKCREYDEPFRMLAGTTAARMRLLESLTDQGFQCTSGSRFQHVTGATDKGRAAMRLKQMYELEMASRVVTVGLGDSMNDLPLLASVDIPVIVPNVAADLARLHRELPRAYVTDRRGPAGWSGAVRHLVGAFATPRFEAVQ